MLLQRLLFLLTLAAAATAQMRDCPGISGDGYKVMLDNLSVFGPGGQTTTLLRDRLRQKVQFDLSAIQLETTPQMVLVPCRDRAPQDVTDFNPVIVDSLNDHRVLVEVWGQIEAHAGLSVQRAQLNFTVVPVNFYDRPVVPPGGFSTAYQRRIGGNPDELVKIFGDFSDLKAYVSIAAGVKSLKEHDYDQAFQCFCRADALLAQPPTGMEPAVRASLVKYVNQEVNNAFTQAHNDQPVRSSLGLDGTRPACPGAL
ncbi:MAG TPA: hypothetical protein VLY04_16515 [Bryobacteraceae bacterium]|nr:hypothetical protein [Bryobacteraceae bacterium]